ncbi:MAG: hypothetical protein WAW34_06030 [Rhodoferax sp.]
MPPVPGQLLLYRFEDGFSARLRAVLRDSDGKSVIPMMDFATVVRITEAGIVIAGTEVVARSSSIKANLERWQQTWWCQIAVGSTPCSESQPPPP